MQNKLRYDIERQHAPKRLIDETIEKLHKPQKFILCRRWFL